MFPYIDFYNNINFRFINITMIGGKITVADPDPNFRLVGDPDPDYGIQWHPEPYPDLGLEETISRP